MNPQLAQVAQLAHLLMTGAVPPNPAMLANLRAHAQQQEAQRMGLDPRATGGVPFSPNIPPPNMRSQMPGLSAVPPFTTQSMKYNEASGDRRMDFQRGDPMTNSRQPNPSVYGHSVHPADVQRREDFGGSRHGGEFGAPRGGIDQGPSGMDRASSSSLNLAPSSYRSQGDLPPRSINLDAGHSSSTTLAYGGNAASRGFSDFRREERMTRDTDARREEDPPARGFSDSRRDEMTSRGSDGGDGSSFGERRGSSQRPADDDTTSRIQRAFDALPATVVGLDCIWEREPDGGSTTYECVCCNELCLTKDDVVPHVLSTHHRRFYLQTRHADFVQRMQARDRANHGSGAIDVDRVAEAAQQQFGAGKIRRIPRPAADSDSKSLDPRKEDGGAFRDGNYSSSSQQKASSANRDSASREPERAEYREPRGATQERERQSLQEEAQRRMLHESLARDGDAPDGSRGYDTQRHNSRRDDGREPDRPDRDTRDDPRAANNDPGPSSGAPPDSASTSTRPTKDPHYSVDPRVVSLHRDVMELMKLEEVEVRKLRAVEREIQEARSRPFDQSSYERLKELAQSSMGKLQKIDQGKKMLQTQNSERLMNLVRDLIDALSEIDQEREDHKRNHTWSAELSERMRAKEIEIKRQLEDIEVNKRRFDAVLEGKAPPETLLVALGMAKERATDSGAKSSAVSDLRAATEANGRNFQRPSEENRQPSSASEKQPPAEPQTHAFTQPQPSRSQTQWSSPLPEPTAGDNWQNRPTSFAQLSAFNDTTPPNTTTTGKSESYTRTENEYEKMMKEMASVAPVAPTTSSGPQVRRLMNDSEQPSVAPQASSSEGDVVVIKETMSRSQERSKPEKSHASPSRDRSSQSRKRSRSRSPNDRRSRRSPSPNTKWGPKRSLSPNGRKGSDSSHSPRRRPRRSPSPRHGASSRPPRRSVSPSTRKWGPRDSSPDSRKRETSAKELASPEKPRDRPRSTRWGDSAASEEEKRDKSPSSNTKWGKRNTPSPNTKWGVVSGSKAAVDVEEEEEEEEDDLAAYGRTVARRPETLSEDVPASSVELAHSWAQQLELQAQRRKEMMDAKKAKPLMAQPSVATSLPTFPSRSAAISMPPKKSPAPMAAAGGAFKPKIQVKVMSGMTGKMGGKALKTGMVPKVNQKSNNASVPTDPMAAYMMEVERMSKGTCEKLGNRGSMRGHVSGR